MEELQDRIEGLQGASATGQRSEQEADTEEEKARQKKV